MTSQRPQGKFEVEREKNVSASAAPLAQSASSLPPLIGQKEGFPTVPWIMERIFSLGLETHVPSCSAPFSTRIGSFSGAALSLLSRHKVPRVLRTKRNHSPASTAKR